jgi:hypothetical protein
MGVFPNVFLKPMEPAVQRIVDRVQSSQPAQAAAPELKLQDLKTPGPRDLGRTR